MRHGETEHAVLGREPGAAADQQIPARDHRRLHDAVAGPLVLPEHRAVGRREADRTQSGYQNDLRDAVDRRQLRRAVTAAVLRAEPARLPCGGIVGGEPAGRGGDDEVVDHQWRARDAPVRDLPAGVGHRVARPDDRAVTGVERVQDAGSTERVDAAVG